jgi:DNA-binding LacI/PurR family transcriptional regulator
MREQVGLLLRRLENRRLEPLRVELAAKLVARDSTAPPGPLTAASDSGL